MFLLPYRCTIRRVSAGSDILHPEGDDVTAFSLLLAAGALWIVFNRIVRSISQMTGAMSEIAAGNASLVVPCVDRRDEMGAMARALLVFKENAEKVQAMQPSVRRSSRPRKPRRPQP